LVASLLGPYRMNWAKLSAIKVSCGPERLSARTETVRYVSTLLS